MRAAAIASLVLFLMALSYSATSEGSEKWITSWAASAQGPYPSGNALVQPDLRRVFPSPEAGAKDQSFRLIVGPDVWGRAARIRLSNAFGTKAVTFDGVFVGLQLDSSAIVPGTNRPVTFAGAKSLTVQPGGSVWSDAISLPFTGVLPKPYLQSRKLAVSFHVAGESGPMTWHAKGLTTSYVTEPGAGSQGANDDEAAFPYGTTSWYFLDAVDMRVAGDTRVVVALGDSITDGTGSTLNGNDRWPDVLSRRLHTKFGDRFSVVNAGIGGNLIAGPPKYSIQKPYPGGPAALQRLERDVASLSGVSTVIWLQGINDFSKNGNASVEFDQVCHQGGDRRAAPANSGCPRHRRHPDLGAWKSRPCARFRRAGHEASGIKHLHSKRRRLRWSDRFRQGHRQRRDRRVATGIRAR